MTSYNKDKQQQIGPAITTYDFNRLVVDAVPDLSDVFLPSVCIEGTNIFDEKLGKPHTIKLIHTNIRLHF